MLPKASIQTANYGAESRKRKSPWATSRMTTRIKVTSAQPCDHAQNLRRQKQKRICRQEHHPICFPSVNRLKAICAHPAGGWVASVVPPGRQNAVSTPVCAAVTGYGLHQCLQRKGRPPQAKKYVWIDNSSCLLWIFPPACGMLCRCKEAKKCVRPWRISTSATSHPANSR